MPIPRVFSLQIVVNETRDAVKVPVLDETAEQFVTSQQEDINSLLPCTSFS